MMMRCSDWIEFTTENRKGITKPCLEHATWTVIWTERVSEGHVVRVERVYCSPHKERVAKALARRGVFASANPLGIPA